MPQMNTSIDPETAAWLCTAAAKRDTSPTILIAAILRAVKNEAPETAEAVELLSPAQQRRAAERTAEEQRRAERKERRDAQTLYRRVRAFLRLLSKIEGPGGATRDEIAKDMGLPPAAPILFAALHTLEKDKTVTRGPDGLYRFNETPPPAAP